MPISTQPFETNGRTYRPPSRPVVVICVDGGSTEYYDAALARDLMPRFKEMSARGWRGLCRGALPSFTNVNNTSIVTGVAPSVHGISGNYFLNPETGEEVMMNSPEFLRADSLLAAAAGAGRRVAVVTSKDKLRRILSHGWEGIAFSAEKAAETSEQQNGIADAEGLVGESAPDIYSADASLFALKAGSVLVEKDLADFLYLSLTDYIQHKHAPEEEEALSFYAGIDREIGRMLDAGAVLGITADHGMNAKQAPDGSPNVIYLETELRERFGSGVRVILPITDPYVKHHGALGSFAMVHLEDQAAVPEVRQHLLGREGITEVYERTHAAHILELPPDRIGDLAVLSARHVVLGRTPEDHDLSAVQQGLRSHGGRYEEMVPFVVSEPLTPEYRKQSSGDLRNFDLFEFTTNLVM